MFWNKSEYRSVAISILVHGFILLLLMAFKFSPKYDINEYVTIGFGTIGQTTSSGAIKKVEKKKVAKKKKDEVSVPKVRNSDETNEVKSTPKAKKKEVEKIIKKKESSKGLDKTGAGDGKLGFELDFGGKGKRKIYSYSIPAYPPGVSKEIDVKLRFTIMPDGSVGRIFPIRKADTRLEAAAISSLRQWRFEALPSTQEMKPQSAVITFPFRLQ